MLKIIGGVSLLGAGVITKVLGLATIIGAPVLVPVGIGLALAGAGLGIWGVVQACRSEPAKESPQPKTPDHKDRSVTEVESKLLNRVVSDLTHPAECYGESAQKTLAGLGLSKESINELKTALHDSVHAKDDGEKKAAKEKADQLIVKAKNHIRDHNSSQEVIEKTVHHTLKFKFYTVPPIPPGPGFVPFFIPVDGGT